jgi:hypothetical protein
MRRLATAFVACSSFSVLHHCSPAVARPLVPADISATGQAITKEATRNLLGVPTPRRPRDDPVGALSQAAPQAALHPATIAF